MPPEDNGQHLIPDQHEIVYKMSTFAYSGIQYVDGFWRFLLKFCNIFQDIDQFIWSDI